MIQINLIGATRKKALRKKALGAKQLKKTMAMKVDPMPLVLGLIVVATAVGGYMWYDRLSSESDDLSTRISAAQVQKAGLDREIQESQIYEARKAALENRISIIEGLKRNQVNPVVSLDILDEAIDRTQYVWLSQLDQNNAIFTMSGTGTSVNAIADFVTNLERTGYFKNINLVNAQDSQGNFIFNMTCEFSPPAVRNTAEPVGGR